MNAMTKSRKKAVAFEVFELVPGRFRWYVKDANGGIVDDGTESTEAAARALIAEQHPDAADVHTYTTKRKG